MRTLTILALTLASLAGCRDQGPELPSFTGHWRGFVDAGVILRITATDHGSEITGVGTFSSGPTGTVAFTVTGVHLHPDVVLTIRAAAFADVNFAGTFDGADMVRGQLNGSGFSGNFVDLSRQ